MKDPRAGLGVDNCRLPCRIEVKYLKDHRAEFRKGEKAMNEKYYYWLDTMPTWTNEEGACALVRGELDEDGEKDRDTEDVILEFTEADCGIDRNDPFRIFPEWDKIDAYIESKLGFVPEYEIN